jgi:hypothetical protein
MLHHRLTVYLLSILPASSNTDNHAAVESNQLTHVVQKAQCFTAGTPVTMFGLDQKILFILDGWGQQRHTRYTTDDSTRWLLGTFNIRHYPLALFPLSSACQPI